MKRMERKEYLRRCRMASMQRRGQRYGANPLNDVWARLDYTGKRYRLTPVGYLLSFDRAGRAEHTARLIEPETNTMYSVRLEDVHAEEDSD